MLTAAPGVLYDGVQPFCAAIQCHSTRVDTGTMKIKVVDGMAEETRDLRMRARPLSCTLDGLWIFQQLCELTCFDNMIAPGLCTPYKSMHGPQPCTQEVGRRCCVPCTGVTT